MKFKTLFFSLFLVNCLHVTAQTFHDGISVQTRPNTRTNKWTTYKAQTVDNLKGFKQGKDPKRTEYGGWEANKTKATGFFRSEYIDGRWWIIDPLGYPYISKGVAVFRAFTSPSQQAKYLAKYQSNANWYTQASATLRENGINSLGSFSDIEITRKSSQPIPYTVLISPMHEYRKQHIKKYGGTYEQANPWMGGYRYDLVMVFDKEFDRVVDSLTKQIVKYKDDPYLLGYFTDNELPWLNDALDRHINLLKPEEAGYKAAKSWLDKRKGKKATAADINDADRQAFTGYYVETYLKKVTSALKKYDPNHMYLGCRFNQPKNELINPEIFRVAGKYMDVISLNHYLKWEPETKQMNEWGSWSGKPFMVTEFYVKGDDSGLANRTGAGWIVPKQQDRGYFYENFTLKLLANKYSVGWQWFAYQDNDPSNTKAGPTSIDSNKGIIDNDYNLYTELLKSMKSINNNAFNLIEYLKNTNNKQTKAATNPNDSGASSNAGEKKSPVNPVDELSAGFTNIKSSTAKPKVYWWWLNGFTDTVRIKEELRAMKNAGIGGADIFEIGLPPASDPKNFIPVGPAFMSDSSVKAISFAIKEAGKLGIEMGLNLASSWNAGGSWVKPEHAAKTLYFSKTPFNKGQKSTKLLFPAIVDAKGKKRNIAYAADGKPVYQEEVAVLAVPEQFSVKDTAEVINISKFFNPKTEMLMWKAPAGKNWIIYRFISSNSGEQLNKPSPNSKGPIIDHFDAAATESHVRYFAEKLLPVLGDFRKTPLRNFYLASYEAKDFAWTSTLPMTFRELNNYDIYKFLPAIFEPEIYNKPLTEHFKKDLKKTYSELMIKNHYGKAKEICNQYGLKIVSEAGGPGHSFEIPAEAIKALGSLDIPRGEFWYNRTFIDKETGVDLIFLVKEIAAASHIYKRGIVEQEAFTSYWDWQEGPGNLKSLADRAFAEGMNRVVVHGFAHNPRGLGYPGIAYWAGTHFNDRNVWWPKVKPFNDYLARISYILQKTNFTSDVIHYDGNQIPNLVPPKNSSYTVGDGYDYEIINTEKLVDELDFKNDYLILPKVGRYKILSLSPRVLDQAEPKVIAKLKLLASKGAIIVSGSKFTDKKALRDGSPDQPIVKELINTGKFKKEKSVQPYIYTNVSPLEALTELNIRPDFSYSTMNEKQLDFIHYELNGTHFYFVRNTSDKWLTSNCSFRQVNKIPSLWNPVTGSVIPMTIYKTNEDSMELPITFAPYASYFVVFTDGVANANHFESVTSADTNGKLLFDYTDKGIRFLEKGNYSLNKVSGKVDFSNRPSSFELNKNWNVSFEQKGNGGSTFNKNFPELKSWTDNEDKQVKFFSGIATYTKEFDFKGTAEGESVYLNLTDVAELADVWINGEHVGISWTPPFQYDITSAIKKGKNIIKIEVANTWSNRLTGDALNNENITQTNIVKANRNLVPWAELPLKKSGLIGPVTITVDKVFKN